MGILSTLAAFGSKVGGFMQTPGGAAGLNLAGGLLGTGMQGDYNAEEAHKNRVFQKMMSNTAYRRAVKDMRAAGLNPVLALGSPASTPGGATAQIGMPQIGDVGSTAISAGLAQQNIQESSARIGNIKEMTRVNKMEADKQEVIKMFYSEFGPMIKELVSELPDKVSGAIDAIPEAFDRMADELTTAFKDEFGNQVQNVERYMQELHRSIVNTFEELSPW